jgi:hypothetical protein
MLLVGYVIVAPSSECVAAEQKPVYICIDGEYGMK